MFALSDGQERIISYEEVIGKLRELEQDEGIGKQVEAYTKVSLRWELTSEI